MKLFLLLKLAIFCLFINGSVAVENYGYNELEVISSVLEEYSLENHQILTLHSNGEILLNRYTDAQLKDADKTIREALLKKVFPAYSENGTNVHIKESDCKNKLDAEELSSKENFASYFNGYLIKIDDIWKIREVKDDKIFYSNDGNVMQLVEFMDAFSSLDTNEYDFKRRKALALIQIKYQIEEDLINTGRNMSKPEREFYNKYNLSSDLIQQASDLKYVFDYFLPNDTENKLYFGIDGTKQTSLDKGKSYNRNSTFASIFKGMQMGWMAYYGYLEELPEMRETYKDSIRMIYSEKKSKELGLKKTLETEVAAKNKEIIVENEKSEDNVSHASNDYQTKKKQTTKNDKEKSRKNKLKMSKKQIERTKILPKKFSKMEQPCNAHLKKAMKKNKESYKYWKPFCNPDGSYKTTEKICRKRRCWCVDSNGMFLKQILKTSKKC